jgi:hypothetical protein
MTSKEVAVVAIGILGAVLLWVRMPAIWRGDLSGDPPPHWHWPRLWRATVRTYPVLAVILPALVVGYAINRSGVSSAVLDAVLVAAYGVAIVGSVLYATVVLVNEPKRLVAPPLRDQPGLIEELRSQRSADSH